MGLPNCPMWLSAIRKPPFFRLSPVLHGTQSRGVKFRVGLQSLITHLQPLKWPRRKSLAMSSFRSLCRN